MLYLTELTGRTFTFSIMIVYYVRVVGIRDSDYCIICHVSFGRGNKEHDDAQELLKDIYYKNRSVINLIKILVLQNVKIS